MAPRIEQGARSSRVRFLATGKNAPRVRQSPVPACANPSRSGTSCAARAQQRPRRGRGGAFLAEFARDVLEGLPPDSKSRARPQQFRARGGIRTHDLRITSALLCH